MTTQLTDQLVPARLVAGGVIARVEYHQAINSTQDRALELARGGDVGPLPLLVVAEEQTAGRGRGTNRWWTGRGSLAVSLLFDPVDWALSRQPRPERSLAVALSIVDTIEPAVPHLALGLHWPNDVFASGKKIAGVLIDVLPDGRHVAGIGLNVNNALEGAPDEVRARATSLCELVGHPLDRTGLLIGLLERLSANMRQLAAAPEEFGQRFGQRCLQVGRQISIRTAGKQTAGRCAGIASDGALLLDTRCGRQRFYSGVLG